MIKSLNQYQTIGIIGLAKNTGKTTTLNAMIDVFHHEPLGLTSIGLDGETLDQVNFLPKPKIDVYPHMVVATAKGCLDHALTDYRIMEETKFHTALGKVNIVQILSKGTIMLAGPTTNHEMNELVSMMKNYVKRIFVDGALSRKTFSAMTELSGIVLATGAAFSPSMDETVAKTKQIIDTFQYPKTRHEINATHAIIIHGEHDDVVLDQKKASSFKEVLTKLEEHPEWIYVRGAFTEALLNVMIDLRLKDFTLICDDPSKLLIDHHKAHAFDILHIQVEVIKPCPLILVTANPFRPTGDYYDKDVFLSRLKNITDIDVINVKDRW